VHDVATIELRVDPTVSFSRRIASLAIARPDRSDKVPPKAMNTSDRPSMIA